MKIFSSLLFIMVLFFPVTSFAQYNDLKDTSYRLRQDMERTHKEIVEKNPNTAVQRAIKSNEKDLEELLKAQKGGLLQAKNQTGPLIPARYRVAVDVSAVVIFIIIVCLALYFKAFPKKRHAEDFHLYDFRHKNENLPY